MINFTVRGWVIICGVTLGVLFLTGRVSAATLSISPASGTFTVGQKITVTVQLNSSDQASNSGQAVVDWTPTTLDYVNLSTKGTIFSYWGIDPALKGDSSVTFSGGLPSPGFSGTGGTVLNISFTAKAVGTATLNISGGKILSNDGQGTDIFSGQTGASYNIISPVPQPPIVTSANFKDSSAWYKDEQAKITWTQPDGLEGVSYELSTDPNTVPDESLEKGTDATITLPNDGTWYLNLRGKYESGWSTTIHFVMHLDRTPPEPFKPTIIQDRGLSDPTPTLNFSTTDTLSGITRYSYAIDDAKQKEATSPVDLINTAPGTHTVHVTAYDLAGNAREGTTQFAVEGYPAPTITAVPTSLLLLDPLTVSGTANNGDTVTVLVNGESVGEAVVGSSDVNAPPGVTVRVPWVFHIDKIFRPGLITVSAKAVSSDGKISVATDPLRVHVNGQALAFNGRTLATWSVVAPLAVLILSLLATIVGIMARLFLAVWLMHKRENLVVAEIEELRESNKRQLIDRRQLDIALDKIETDLEGGNSRRRKKPRRR